MSQSPPSSTEHDPVVTWSSLRQQFPVADRYVYLNHAAVSPLPRHCTQKMEQYLIELATHGAAHYPAYLPELIQRARTLGAKLLGTTDAHVFFVRSTTQGLSIPALGLPFGAGDNLVLVRGEFPANLRPWLPLRRRGVELRIIEQRAGRVQLDDLRAAMDAKTRAVSVSYVQYRSGFRLNLAAVSELCRQRDALLVVDGIQGVGALPIDVSAWGVDFLSADAHKWMMGPEGVGLGFASDRALERITPALEGWLSVQRPFDFDDLDQPLKETAARYEEGALNVAGIHGLIGSLELLLTLGVAAVHQRILDLTDQLCARLRAQGWQIESPRHDPDEKSGIVLATRPDLDCAAVASALRAQRIIVSARGNGLRFSPHCYNTIADLEQLLEELPA